MKGKVGKSADRISDLPVHVLHQILTFVPIKDAIRTSVLSKQWNSIQKCFPVMKFELRERRHGEFVEFVERSLQNFVRSKLCMDRISLSVSYFDEDSVLVVNKWLPLALHYGVSDLSFEYRNFFDRKTFLLVHDQYYPLPQTTFSINSALLRDSSKSFILQKIELSWVFLSDSMVRDIIRNCPNLRDLRLLYVDGLETLTIFKPVKLARLTIMVPGRFKEFESIIVDAISLEHFSLRIEHDDPYFPYGAVGDPYFPNRMIDLTSCSNLRELELSNSTISNASFNMNISRFTLLEVVNITACCELKILKISLHRLKHLKIDSCQLLEAIEIDAPILSKFIYTLTVGEFAELILPNEIPGSMYLTCSRSTYYARLDSSWFFKIREYLTVPFKGITYSFNCYDFDPEEFSFDHDDLKEALIPPLVEVDCLDLSDLCVNSAHWETLLDGLLWSCHPKMIRLEVTTIVTTMRGLYKKNWTKTEALCKMLNESECRLCCNLPRCKCWRYRLKTVKIESMKGIVFRDLDCQSIKDYYLSNPEDNEVKFVFDWDHSA